ncbi:hypothetical protein AMES_7173 [Amycolatopsis mediterranei S699]|uniref:Uncharacterized protein n=2 Tax=Amycolatopsis mediterranei TaxID=33910 RepID=A0A0H3DH84_AMYMU|nr:hypothetical protein [Amycolatopsis mediterranei]ADJ48999.1 hypothetical protein AMED_7283 [Amycolatopsis mediterranei U32]AEK45949.1 hypothetical protein RAM_37410 [Amycolatopsis mediterranei S699]AFO80707.1 hypothetical protein AMES_7173 [Amycolatopsis mediterranei S699]AGT87835.1 hypothetical protein B737_7173 [Amycolatopsis mediterranei RB]KDU93883.1 hypothetical protein DV36_00665 [Amycolatopsis mediterranei]
MTLKPEPVRWQPPAPRELPALREHLADYLQTEYAYLFTTEALRQGRGTLRPDVGPETGAVLLLADEYQRLRDAQLFYVTADITKLVRQAAPSLQDKWEIQPHDLPARTGFMLFAEPIAEYIRATDGKRIDIVGVSWGGTELLTSETGGLWLSFWSVTDFAAVKRLAREAGATEREAEVLGAASACRADVGQRDLHAVGRERADDRHGVAARPIDRPQQDRGRRNDEHLATDCPCGLGLLLSQHVDRHGGGTPAPHPARPGRTCGAHDVTGSRRIGAASDVLEVRASG